MDDSIISNIGEFELIRQLTGNIRYTQDVITGIGDDAAVIKIDNKEYLLITTDILIEDVHFTIPGISAYQLGWKAIAVNISDIAAMGGYPAWTVISIGLPSKIYTEFVKELYTGVEDICRKYNVQLVGGDTSSSEKIIISITIVGKVRPEHLVCRCNANIDDLVVVTYTVGDAGIGLYALKQNLNSEIAQQMIKKHLQPIPRIEEAHKIITVLSPTAMIDISDGLASEIYHICNSSKVGVEIYYNKIPVSEAMIEVAHELGKDPLNIAFSSGEDYELLFTIPPQKAKLIDRTGIPLTIIGTIKDIDYGYKLIRPEGTVEKFIPCGYKHF